MSQYCPALPAPTCPTTPAFNQCHQVSTYDHSSYQNYCCSPTPQYTTPQLDQCSSHNQTGKFKQLLGDFEQIKVCGQADILCDLDVGGVLNVTTIQSNTATVNINDNLNVLGTLDVCNIECPGGTLTLHGTVSIPTLATSNLDASILMNVVNFATTVNIAGTLNACSISCNDGGVVNFGTVTNFSTNVVVQGTLYACSISCNDGGAVNFGTVTNFATTVNVAGTLNACSISCPNGTVNFGTVTNFATTVNVAGTLNACSISCPNGVVNFGTVTNFATTVNIAGTLNACSISCPNGTINFGTVTNFATTVNVNGTLNACSISCPNGTINFGTVVNFATTVNVAGTLNVCSIACPSGTLNIASTLAVNTLFSNNVTICVDSIVTDVINQPFTSTLQAANNGTLVLPATQGPCGNTVPVLPLTSVNGSIKYAVISDGAGGSALDIQYHAGFAGYAISPVTNVVQPGVPTFSPFNPAVFLGYLSPTPVAFNTPFFQTNPPFSHVDANGCIVLDSIGFYNLEIQMAIDVANNTLNTPFFNLRYVATSNATGLQYSSGILNTYTIADGSGPTATTAWNNLANTLSGYALTASSAVSHGYIVTGSIDAGVPVGGLTMCFYLDNQNTVPINLAALSANILYLG